MKILVLHNNNLPFFLRSQDEVDFNLKDDLTIYSKILKYHSYISNLSYDSFICRELSFLKDEWFDLIILPYTFNEDNYMEYSGLRVAAHIRLTKGWHHISAPILFLGPDSIDDIIRLSEFGGIISSYRIFLSDTHGEDEIEMKIREIVNNYPHDCEIEKNHLLSHHYSDMISKLTIKAPANYATHHSVANEWAIIRWTDMIQWKKDPPEIKNKSVLDQLFFKYLLTKVSSLERERESFDKRYKKNNPTSPIISGIEGKRIIYFDDEGEKGWNDLLGMIFTESKATFIPFPISKGMSKDQLLSEAKQFADANQGDCYLIDLRLHDDDFDTDVKPEDLTGYKLASYIKYDEKNGNKGRQIVFFSASNKVWNYKNIMINYGKSGFVVKESPEYNYSRKETESNYGSFCNAIKESIKMSYISEYVKILDHCKTMEPKHWNVLDQFVDMLLYDEKKTVKYNVLNLYVFLDSYLSSRYQLDASNLLLKSNSQSVCKYNPLYVVFDREKRKDGYKHIRFRQSTKEPFSNKTEKTLDISADSELPVVIVSLRYYYNMSEDNCNKVQRLRTERNQCVAHSGGETNLATKDIRDIFENIIIPIIKKDFS